ncbi:MAG: hypothetical protein F6K65_17810 [Moorea sp. SIO3C2]|nr:hypothetical protein [Moorena sp. SIO3C2]
MANLITGQAHRRGIFIHKKVFLTLKKPSLQHPTCLSPDLIDNLFMSNVTALPSIELLYIVGF